MKFLLLLRVIGRWLRRTLLVGTRRRIEVFWLERRPAPRIPFRLPFRIALIGAPCRELLTGFKRPGIKISRYEFFEQTRHEYSYPHVVVVDYQELKHALHVLRDADLLRDLPVLIVAVGSPWKSARAAASLPDGVALAAISGPSARGFLAELPGELTDDVPLDRAVRNAARGAVKKRRGGVLILDRYVNQALRVADLADMAGFHPSGDQADNGAAGSSKAPRLTFDEVVRNVDSKSASISPYPSEVQPRELSVAVMHGLFLEGGQRAVPAGATLQIGTDYLVQVHIGGKSESARWAEPGAHSAAPLDDGATLLEIALQAKDFQLRSAGTQPLLLPVAGPSFPVFFAVRTPLQPGMHQLRVVAYRRNHMLQTSLLEIEVAGREYRQGSTDLGVTAKVEFSQTTGFHEVKDIPLRALTIGVNLDAQGTHSLMIKGQGAAVPLQINGKLVSDQLKEYRDRLIDATFRNGYARSWGNQPNALSKKFILDLAYEGRDLHRAYFDSYNEALSDTLEKLVRTEDQVISIVRHDPRFAFPWPIFYDYRLPRIKLTAEVCFGKQDGAPCKHDRHSGVCCVRGFWGFRHVIEEVMGNVRDDQRVDSIVRYARRGNLHFQIDPVSSVLSSSLLKMAPQATEYSLGTDLINTLWDSTQRPSLLLLLAHLEDGSVAGRPEGPRIQFLDANGTTEWFAANDILDEVAEQKYWGQPNSLVLLLNCKSAEISPATLSNFVTAFHQARAGAVVGTEVPAYSDLMERFGLEFTRAMWIDGKTLGQSVRIIRRILLQEGNPLGFIFTSIGCAELHFLPETPQ